MFWIIFVMVVSFVLIFVASLLEVVWLTVWNDDVITYEGRIKGPNAATKAVRTLLCERMVVVGFILFAIHLLTYFTPLVLGWLSYGMNGWISSLLVVYAILLFFFGEIVSKNVGYKRAMAAAVWSALPLRMLLQVLFPVTWALKQTNRLTGGQDRRLFREEDVVAAAQAAQEDGALNRQETALIRRAITMGNFRVEKVYIPLAKVLTIPLRPTRKQLSDAAAKHSHIIVCSGENTVIGAITRKDAVPILARDTPPDQPIDLPKDIIRAMLDLPKTMLIAEAFEFLRGDDVACEVTDEHGKTIGIVRTRDVATRLFETEIDDDD